MSLLPIVLSLVLLTPPENQPPTIITGVTVIDTTGGPAKKGQTVVISRGVVSMVIADELFSPISPDSPIIDGRGKFLIPGLWDMHAHLPTERSIPLNIANGITGVRVMWGNPALTGFPVPHSAWKKQIENGKRLGPRIALASNMLDGPKPFWPGSRAIHNEADAFKAVRDSKAAGADFIKVYSLLTPEGFRSIAREAKQQGLPFAGHVPTLISASEASDLGMKSMEHLYGVMAACSPREAEALAQRKKILDENHGDWSIARTKLAPLDIALRESYDEKIAAKFFAKLKANGTYQCPTLVVLRALGSMDDAKFKSDDRVKYVDPFVRLFWDPKLDTRFKSLKPEDYANQRKAFARGMELVGEMHKAGVPILAGTDEANPYIFAGFSLHDELALLVKSGLTPLEALQAATINPARYFGITETAGSVAPGKVADLVLLDGDPTVDISNTTRINAVFVRGKLQDRKALDALLLAAQQKPSNASSQPAGFLPGGYCAEH